MKLKMFISKTINFLYLAWKVDTESRHQEHWPYISGKLPADVPLTWNISSCHFIGTSDPAFTQREIMAEVCFYINFQLTV